jgi:hypothetical protein
MCDLLGRFPFIPMSIQTGKSVWICFNTIALLHLVLIQLSLQFKLFLYHQIQIHPPITPLLCCLQIVFKNIGAVFGSVLNRLGFVTLEFSEIISQHPFNVY